MGGIPVPKPSMLDVCSVCGISGGRKIYKDPDESIFYTWDSLHGEVEVFNKRGIHIGVADPQTGIMIKPAVPGRRIEKPN